MSQVAGRKSYNYDNEKADFSASHQKTLPHASFCKPEKMKAEMYDRSGMAKRSGCVAYVEIKRLSYTDIIPNKLATQDAKLSINSLKNRMSINPCVNKFNKNDINIFHIYTFILFILYV